MNKIEIAKRLSFLICTQLCKQMFINDKCKDCEIAKLLNQLAYEN